MKSHLFITKLAVQSQLWKLEIWETSQIPFIQNIHIEKKKGKKKAFSTSQINHYIAPCRRLSGWYLVPCVINTDKKKPPHTRHLGWYLHPPLSGCSSLLICPPKKRQDKKKKKRGKVPVFFPTWTIWTNVCREKGSWEQFGLKGNKGFQMSPAYSAALPDLKLEVLKVWW